MNGISAQRIWDFAVEQGFSFLSSSYQFHLLVRVKHSCGGRPDVGDNTTKIKLSLSCSLGSTSRVAVFTSEGITICWIKTHSNQSGSDIDIEKRNAMAGSLTKIAFVSNFFSLDTK